MKLGAFSISLAVKDIPTSQDFYEKLGFEVVGGDPVQGWLILRHGTTTLGLFCGMFPSNMMTFNPGWDATAQPEDAFDDVRALQAEFAAKGLEVGETITTNSTGPTSFMVQDPDGNTILFDQHL